MVEATWYLDSAEMDGIPGGRTLRVASDASTPQALRTASLVRLLRAPVGNGDQNRDKPRGATFLGTGYDLYYENLLTINHTTNNLGHYTLQ